MTPLRFGIPEAAEAMSISQRKLEDLIASGAITAHQDTAGGHRYISAESIMRYIREREEVQCVGRFQRRTG